MAVPTIDPESSVLAYPQWLPWEHTFSASNSPTSWSIASGGVPTGMTFQAPLTATGSNTGDTINRNAHGLANGTLIAFTTLTGGTGLATATRYYVINAEANTFQVSTTLGGAVVPIIADYSAIVFVRLGHLSGAATLPGISTLRLTASNGDGASAEVRFTIGIEPAANAPDGNIDLVWDLATNIVSRQDTSGAAPSAGNDPVLNVKEGDDLMARMRFRKGGTFIDLAVTGLRFALKEFEPEGEIVVGNTFVKEGEDTTANYLFYAQFIASALASSLSNYEADGGTFYVGLGEFEVTFTNPESIGPAELVRSSATFAVRVERDIAENI